MTPPRRSSAIRQHSSSAFLPHPLGVRPRRQVDHCGEAVDIQFLSRRVSHIERGNCALQRSFERRERSRDAGRADTFTRADPHARRLEATFATEATSAPAVGDAEPGHHATMPATCVFDSRLIPAERPLPGVAKNVDQVLAKPWAVGIPVSHESARAPDVGRNRGAKARRNVGGGTPQATSGQKTLNG